MMKRSNPSISSPRKGKHLSAAGNGKKYTKPKVAMASLIKVAFLLSIGGLIQSLRTDSSHNIGIDLGSDIGSGGGESRLLSPYFSNIPLTKSLHPKYKLWTEMSTKEQDTALKSVQKIMNKYALLIAPKDKSLQQWQDIKQGTCELDPEFGKNGHKICGPRLTQPCSFISFGINDDPSFDRELGDWGCRGFAGDPTVQHPSKLHDKVTFHNVGATMLQDNEERLINKGGVEDWWMTSFPKLRYFLGLDKIDILKIDCEGCEVALSRDMLREDPYFLSHVDQISIETHMTKTWMTSNEHVYYFGLLLVLLEEAGFVMEWSSIFGCSKRHEVAGCMDSIVESGWPCGYDPWPGHPTVVKGRSCQEYTWKRYA
uniref:Methyltransferase domain-containing protein n=1 Tax=Chaetoceros debilis TaxID=122233 RepID=A0A7S3QJH9_9STRA|mmetsp:Transcript_13927/g.20787  ORF Transcript_13927/g.20787 Transcript_13927/m.20787 type:complete len:370 (-) Transcript_13927:196-1305(-)